MAQVKIVNMSELPQEYDKDVRMLYCEGFLKNAIHYQGPTEKLAAGLENAFVLNLCYVATYEDRVVGMTGFAPNMMRMINVTGLQLRKGLGVASGMTRFAGLTRMLSELLTCPEDECLIECSVVAEDAPEQTRAMLVYYLLDHLRYKKYTAEVGDNNQRDIDFYTGLGFEEEFRRRPLHRSQRFHGADEHVYLARERRTSAERREGE